MLYIYGAPVILTDAGGYSWYIVRARATAYTTALFGCALCRCGGTTFPGRTGTTGCPTAS